MLPIPTTLESKLSQYNKHFSKNANQALQSLLVFSDYANRHIEVLKELSENFQTPMFFSDYNQSIATLYQETLPSLYTQLRCFRHKCFLRLLLREKACLSDTEETMRSWSDFADSLILFTLKYCQLELSKKYGIPCDEAQNPTQMDVLAMGKLGGQELNFSSDIDLIFVYSKAGFTNGAESISNQQYYSKVVQLLIQLFEQRTAEGFVFRVDLRLRPNGESGALVSSLAAIETYYQEQGRDWERYAMVKARVIGNSPPWFQQLIVPFTYRRYVDFSVIESLRSMKSMIEREIQRNPALDDIKRGYGGIREIEFIIQNFQLIRGGRIIPLRCQNAMQALNALKEEKLLAKTEVLKKAYLFLRKLENILQAQNDQQTHSLPKDELKRAQIAFAMGFTDWDSLIHVLEKFQRIVRRNFSRVLGQSELFTDEGKLISHQLSNLWQGHIEAFMAINLLDSLHFSNPERCYQLLHDFKHSPRCRRLSQAARLRLDRFMGFLLHELSKMEDSDTVLLNVLQLLDNIVGRSAYLALLTENPQVLKELLHWLANSPYISQLLVNHPFLLETLLDESAIWSIPNKKQLEKLLEQQLQYSTEYEQLNDILRQFKLKNNLLAARAELNGQYQTMRIARFLSDVAEVIVGQVTHIACQQLNERHPELIPFTSRFAILAYGKLGSREMNFDSDLDLVFIHAATSEEEGLITRLTQKILHMLTIRSQSGLLYSVDTRLRPSGSAGLLVSHVDAFAEYQRTKAWTWEHQALIRARVISGNQTIKNEIKKIKQDIILTNRDLTTLQQEVLNMRAKIGRYEDKNRIKFGEGGLLDLEFLVQYLVLAYPRLSFSEETNTRKLLQLLALEGVITKEQSHTLRKVFQYFHKTLHRNILKPEKEYADNYKVYVREISKNIFSTINAPICSTQKNTLL